MSDMGKACFMYCGPEKCNCDHPAKLQQLGEYSFTIGPEPPQESEPPNPFELPSREKLAEYFRKQKSVY